MERYERVFLLVLTVSSLKLRPQNPPPRLRFRIAVALALVALVALLIFLLLGRKKPEKQRTASSPPAETTGPRISHGRVPSPPPPPGPVERVPPSEEAEPLPVIDEITVEKEEVCEGEENLVTVRAHTVNNTDPWLRYMIGRETGQQIPIKALMDDGQQVQQQILVFGRGGVATTAQVPPFVVKDCRQERGVLVAFQVMPNTWGRFEFWAKIATTNPDAPTFAPASYEWDFGDGAFESTSGPIVEHDFESRPQDTLVSNYLVTVEVISNDGQKLVGRRGVEMFNPAFENLHDKGFVVLMTAMTPRFPVMGEDGLVEQKVHIWHHRPDPVRITEIKVMRYYIDSSDYAPLELGNIEQLLGGSTIPPGSGIEATFTFDAGVQKDISHVTYWLEGWSAESYPVRGSVSIMRPPGKPTKKDHEPVVNPELKEKIIAARKILGKEFVTDEDIWRLEREGRLGVGADASAPGYGVTQ